MSHEPLSERDVTVVVPVHDERVEFEEILARYAQEFEKRGLTCEFVFVLDGTPDALFEELGRIQVVDVVLPIVNGPELRLRCVTEPDKAQAALLDRLGLRLPKRLHRPEQLAKCSGKLP